MLHNYTELEIHWIDGTASTSAAHTHTHTGCQCNVLNLLHIKKKRSCELLQQTKTKYHHSFKTRNERKKKKSNSIFTVEGVKSPLIKHWIHKFIFPRKKKTKWEKRQGKVGTEWKQQFSGFRKPPSDSWLSLPSHWVPPEQTNGNHFCCVFPPKRGRQQIVGAVMGPQSLSPPSNKNRSHGKFFWCAKNGQLTYHVK